FFSIFLCISTPSISSPIFPFVFPLSSFLLSLPHSFFFFNDPAPTEIYTLSLHDALPIFDWVGSSLGGHIGMELAALPGTRRAPRSEEHTSELQSPCNLVCRLLLEKKKKKKKKIQETQKKKNKEQTITSIHKDEQTT